MNSQELLTPKGAANPLGGMTESVALDMCFKPKAVPSWLKLRAGSLNDAPEIRCRLHDAEPRHGNCYKLALLGCPHGGKDWTLVHGETVGPRGIGRMGHAWLERDGWVL